MPVLPNRKTNRQALPAPSSSHPLASVPPITPCNKTETVIWAAWHETLQIESFSIHDNFFDLGGHPILAAGTVSRFEAELERPCPLGLLFEHPTVAELAAAFARPQSESAADVPVAVLHSHGNSPGLFLLAGAETCRCLSKRPNP